VSYALFRAARQLRSVLRLPNLTFRGRGESEFVPSGRLLLGRALALAGDTAKARAAYQNFLTLWKDADPDLKILRHAKAEYSVLR